MFETNQRVLCIDDRTVMGDECPNIGLGDLKAGQIYTIRSFSSYGFEMRDMNIYLGGLVHLREVQLHVDRFGEAAYCAERFRPVDDPSMKIFREMTREKETEDA